MANEKILGLLLIVVGTLFPTVVFPLAIYNTFSVSAPTVTCDASNYCTASVSITNNNATEPANIWFVGGLQSGSTSSFSILKPVTTAVGSTTAYTQGLGYLAGGSYFLNVKVLGASGSLLSTTGYVTFKTGTVTLTVDPSSGNSIAVSPSPVSQAANGMGGTVYTYQTGTVVSITATLASTNVFSSWCVIPGSCTYTQNPLSITLNQNTEVALQTAPAASQLYYDIQEGTSGDGSISPAGVQRVYQSSSAGPTSITFTATPTAQHQFNWMAVMGTTPVINSTSGTLTLSYSQLSAANAANPALVYARFDAQPLLTVQDSPLYAGQVTLTPSIGLHFYPKGTQVALTASGVSSGYSWGGWIVDGTVVTQSSSYTLTMNGAHTVMPNVLKNQGGQNNGCQIQAGQTSCTSGTVTCTIQGGVQNCSGLFNTVCTATGTATYTTTNLIGQTGTTTSTYVSLTTVSGQSTCSSGPPPRPPPPVNLTGLAIAIPFWLAGAFVLTKKKRRG